MTRLRPLSDPNTFPALREEFLHRSPAEGLGAIVPRPRVLLLYRSLRERSYGQCDHG